MDLHKRIMKGAGFCSELMRKTIFKIDGILSANVFIQHFPKKKKKNSQHANIGRFIIFLVSYTMQIACKLKCGEKSCSRKYHGQNYDFIFLSSKIIFNYHATWKCCIISFIKRQNDPIITIVQEYLFCTKKKHTKKCCIF